MIIGSNRAAPRLAVAAGALVVAGALLVSPRVRTEFSAPLALGLSLGLAVLWTWLGPRLQRGAAAARFADVAAFDPFSGWRLPLFALACLLVRWPLISSGSYGTDFDAWRVALSSLTLWETGFYRPSRPPGYPLFEFAVTPFVALGGPLAANLATAVVGFFGLFAFDRVARLLAVPAAGLLTLTLAFHPLFLLNSAVTMDYVWALSLLLAALWAGLRDRWALAAALLAAGAACRPTTMVFAAPVVAWALATRRMTPRTLLRAGLAFVAAAAVCFYPLLSRYGLDQLTHTGSVRTWLKLSARTVEAWGFAPLLLTPLLIVDALRSPRRDGAHAALLGSMMVVGALLLVYLMVEAAYLLPFVALAMLFLGRLLSPPAVLAWLAAAVLSLGWSPVIGGATLQAKVAANKKVVAVQAELAAADLPRGAVVVTGWAFPALLVTQHDRLTAPTKPKDNAWQDQDRSLTYVPFLGEDVLQEALGQGREIVLLDQGTDRGNQGRLGRSLLLYGARTLAELQAAQAAQVEQDARTPASLALSRRPDLVTALELPHGTGGPPLVTRVPLSGKLGFITRSGKVADYAVDLPDLGDWLPEGDRQPQGFRVYGPGGRELRWSWKQKPWTWMVTASHGRLRIRLPAGLDKPEASAFSVELDSASAAARSLRLDQAGLSDQDFVFRSVDAGGRARPGLLLPAPARVAFQVTVPDGGVLHFDTELLQPPLSGPVASDVQLVVGVVADGQAGLQERARIDLLPGQVDEQRLDLGPYGGQSVTLELRSEGGDGVSAPVFVGAPTLVGPADQPQHIVVVAVDGLRTDHLGLDPDSRSTSPGLDVWATGAFVFPTARSPSPSVAAALKAAWSGRVPRAWTSGASLPATFRSAGFDTALFSTQPALPDALGAVARWTEVQTDADAAALLSAAEAWLAARPQRDAVLVLHLGGLLRPVSAPAEGESGAAVVAGYGAALGRLDTALGPFLARLGSQATVAVFAPYAEPLGDGGDWLHDDCFGEAALRVPLLLAGPDIEPGRSAATASLFDLAPTLQALAGISPDPDAIGRSLLPTIGGDETAARRLSARLMPLGWPAGPVPAWGVASRRQKWVNRAGIEQVFALDADPLEQVDLSRERGTNRSTFRDALAWWTGSSFEPAWLLRLRARPKAKADVQLRMQLAGGAQAVHAVDLAPTVDAGRFSVTLEQGDAADGSVLVWPGDPQLDPAGLALQLHVDGQAPTSAEIMRDKVAVERPRQFPVARVGGASVAATVTPLFAPLPAPAAAGPRQGARAVVALDP